MIQSEFVEHYITDIFVFQARHYRVTHHLMYTKVGLCRQWTFYSNNSGRIDMLYHMNILFDSLFFRYLSLSL